jgi:hypothetical protein
MRCEKEPSFVAGLLEAFSTPVSLIRAKRAADTFEMIAAD